MRTPLRPEDVLVDLLGSGEFDHEILDPEAAGSAPAGSQCFVCGSLRRISAGDQHSILRIPLRLSAESGSICDPDPVFVPLFVRRLQHYLALRDDRGCQTVS